MLKTLQMEEELHSCLTTIVKFYKINNLNVCGQIETIFSDTTREMIQCIKSRILLAVFKELSNDSYYC